MVSCTACTCNMLTPPPRARWEAFRGNALPCVFAAPLNGNLRRPFARETYVSSYFRAALWSVSFATQA